MTAAISGAEKWVSFYHGMAVDVHPERWAAAGLSFGAAEKLLVEKRSLHTLSVHPECLAPGWDFAWNPWEEVGGICPGWALWRGERLWRAGMFFALGCLRSEATRLVRREDVLALREECGEDAQSFALRRAVLIWPEEWPGAAAGLDDRALPERLRLVAVRGLACWLSGLPPGLASRVCLKLPPWLDGPLSEAKDVWEKEARGLCLKRLARLDKLAADL